MGRKIVMDYRKSLATEDFEQQPFGVVRTFLILVMSVMASITIATHVAQMCGISFFKYTIMGTGITIITAIFVLWKEIPKNIYSIISDHSQTFMLLFCICLMCGLLCLVSFRPDTDDSYYIPNAVYYLAHVNEPMGFEFHAFYSGDVPLITYYTGTSLPYEYMQGIAAYLFDMHFMTVYYIFAPALFGLMIPLAWFYIVSRFVPVSRAAIAGSVLICLSLLLMGEQHRSFGNFVFNRIFQGKIIFMSIGIPLFAALTIDFFRSPSVRRWMYLFVTSVAMVGLSSCSAMMIPLLALVLAIACAVSYVPNKRRRILFVFLYLAALFYLVMYAGSILLFSVDQLVWENPLQSHWPNTFWDQAKLVFGGPVVLTFFMTGIFSALLVTRKNDRYFIFLWITLLIAFYLNPFTAPLMMNYITSKLLYWRLFYLLPFPLVLGISCAILVLLMENAGIKKRYIVMGLVILLMLSSHFPKFSSSVFRHGTGLGLPRYKVANMNLAQQVLAVSPPQGPMLALAEVGQAIPILSAEYPQIYIRSDGIRMWGQNYGKREEGKHRIKASRFLGGIDGQSGLDSMTWLIRQYPEIRSIVALRRVAEADNGNLFKLLLGLGFSENRITENLAVFIKPI